MKTFTKALAGTVAAGAMALASASPAYADEYYDRYDRDDGIDAGEIIAGAVILGGIAAVVSSIGDDDDYDYDDRNYRYRDRYDYRDNYRRGSARQAIDRCVRAATQDARRYSYGRARVTEIRDVDRKDDGYKVRGTIVLDERRSGRWDRYDRWDRDDRDRYDEGRFTCEIRYGRITEMDYDGLRGLD